MIEALSLYHQVKRYVMKEATDIIFFIQKEISIINYEIFEMDMHLAVITPSEE
jgi:hypothetical protein